MTDNELKMLQNEQLGMLKELNNICDKHNLKCFMAYGSLLGTIRHNGTIPWDYDIDVLMFRDEFLKLSSVMVDELPSHLFFKPINSKNLNHVGLARIYQKDTRVYYKDLFEEDRIDGIHIDIFVIDNAKKVPKLINTLTIFLCRFLALCQLDNFERKWLYKTFKNNFIKKLVVFLSAPFSYILSNEAIQKVIFLLNTSNEYNGEGVVLQDLSSKSFFSIAGFYEPVRKLYEDEHVWITSDFHEHLKHMYGDYMILPSVEKRFTSGMKDVVIKFRESELTVYEEKGTNCF